jgi:hypothetical protein
MKMDLKFAVKEERYFLPDYYRPTLLALQSKNASSPCLVICLP